MFNKISIKVCSPKDNMVSKLEVMLKDWLPKDFKIDFHGDEEDRFVLTRRVLSLTTPSK